MNTAKCSSTLYVRLVLWIEFRMISIEKMMYLIRYNWNHFIIFGIWKFHLFCMVSVNLYGMEIEMDQQSSIRMKNLSLHHFGFLLSSLVQIIHLMCLVHQFISFQIKCVRLQSVLWIHSCRKYRRFYLLSILRPSNKNLTRSLSLYVLHSWFSTIQFI